MNDPIKKKVVVITGGSSGLGEASARLLARHGARIVLGARRMERMQAVIEAIQAEGGEAIAVQTDVTDEDQVRRLVQAAIDQYGQVDALLNNAGLMPQSLLELGRSEDWNRMIDVNIKGVLYGIAAVLPYMRARKSGHIINVSSVAGHKVRAGGAVYSATKHAVRVISEGLRQEVKPYNIRTTVISPGAVDTELPASATVGEVRDALQKYYDDIAIPADSFARALLFAMSQPEDVDINEILFRPTRQEY